MASLRPKPLSPLGFMLFVLCMHRCSARMLLMGDLKQGNARVHADVKSPSLESEDIDPRHGFEDGVGPYVRVIAKSPSLESEDIDPRTGFDSKSPSLESEAVFYPGWGFRPPRYIEGDGPCTGATCKEVNVDANSPSLESDDRYVDDGAAPAGKDDSKPTANKSNNKAQEGEKLVSSVPLHKKRQDSAKQADEPKPPESSSELNWKMADAPMPASYSNDGGSKLLV